MLSLGSLTGSPCVAFREFAHAESVGKHQCCLCARFHKSAVYIYSQRRHLAKSSRCTLLSRTHRSVVVQAQLEHGDDHLTVNSDDMSSEIGKDEPNILPAQLCLCGVAILWGTYSPVVRYIYACDGPPSPAALTAVRTVIQAAVLLASNLVVSQQQLNSSATPTKRSRPLRKSSSPNLSRTRSGRLRPLRRLAKKCRKALNSTTDELWVVGVELGLWNFCGSTFQAVGLQHTTATRGAFLIQVSTTGLSHQISRSNSTL